MTSVRCFSCYLPVILLVVSIVITLGIIEFIVLLLNKRKENGN